MTGLVIIVGLLAALPGHITAEHENGPGILYFQGTGLDGAILLEWATAVEIDTFGFNLERADSKTGPYVVINDTIIPAIGGPVTGAKYVYEDNNNVVNGQTYWYFLVEIDIDGNETYVGPISAEAGIPTLFYLPIMYQE